MLANIINKIKKIRIKIQYLRLSVLLNTRYNCPYCKCWKKDREEILDTPHNNAFICRKCKNIYYVEKPWEYL